MTIGIRITLGMRMRGGIIVMGQPPHLLKSVQPDGRSLAYPS